MRKADEPDDKVLWNSVGQKKDVTKTGRNPDLPGSPSDNFPKFKILHV